jgi:hypothetical protein
LPAKTKLKYNEVFDRERAKVAQSDTLKDFRDGK